MNYGQARQKKFDADVTRLADAPGSNAAGRTAEIAEKLSEKHLTHTYPDYNFSRKENLHASGPDIIGQHKTWPNDFIFNETKVAKAGSANPARHLINTGSGVQGSAT